MTIDVQPVSGADVVVAAAARRRTFAIISHPDAGKTTLTEKLLLYGGAVAEAGAVKARRGRREVTSDWMDLERRRGGTRKASSGPPHLAHSPGVRSQECPHARHSTWITSSSRRPFQSLLFTALRTLGRGPWTRLDLRVRRAAGPPWRRAPRRRRAGRPGAAATPAGQGRRCASQRPHPHAERPRSAELRWFVVDGPSDGSLEPSNNVRVALPWSGRRPSCDVSDADDRLSPCGSLAATMRNRTAPAGGVA